MKVIPVLASGISNGSPARDHFIHYTQAITIRKRPHPVLSGAAYVDANHHVVRMEMDGKPQQ